MRKVDINDVIIGRNIKRYVKMKNITLDALAEKVGVGNSTLSEWINGKRPVTAYALCKISKALSISVEKLCEGVEVSPYLPM